MKEKIRNDLKNGSTISEVCEKYHLTFKGLLKVFKQDFNSYTRPHNVGGRRTSATGERYIYQKNAGNTFWIQKGGQYYGYYKSLTDAVAVRNGLIINNWDKNELDTICQKLGVKREIRKYV